MSVEMDDVELFKKICEKMGIPFEEGKDEITINGIPALEYYKTHNLFELDVDSVKELWYNMLEVNLWKRLFYY